MKIKEQKNEKKEKSGRKKSGSTAWLIEIKLYHANHTISTVYLSQ